MTNEKPKPPKEVIRPVLLGLKEVSRMLGVSGKTVAKLVEIGRLAKPRTVHGKIKRWFPRDVETYLERLYRGEFEGEE